MPRGRPKTTIPPCRFCSRQFKRLEHLVRHERTHTQEKPFVCECGRKFTRQDLLTRHAKVHVSYPSEPSHLAVPEVSQEPTISTDADINNFDFLWETNFATRDMLPATFFDPNFLLDEMPLSAQPRPITSSFSRFSSRLPRLDDTEKDIEDDAEEDSIAEDKVDSTAGNNTAPWCIAGSVYERFCFDVQTYSHVLPTGCSMPSKHNLSRYLELYLRCAYKALPFIHPTTFLPERATVELLLAMTMHGSLARYEFAKSYELYFMAKAILLEKIRLETLQLASDILSKGSYRAVARENSLERIQTLILLISFASWADRKILPDALSMSSQLAMLVRAEGISKSDEMPQDVDWLSWIAVEERRRTLLAAYSLLNMHSVAFGIPPLILNHEIGVSLPGYTEQWTSETEAEWRQLPRQAERRFQTGLRSLFDGTETPKKESVSSFANYLLIHGLLQQIYIDRHGSAGLSQPETTNRFTTALCTWQKSWEMGDESTLDPLSPKGTLALSATALLRIAYFRLNSDFAPCRGLLSGDLLCTPPNLTRLPYSDGVILHAAHALSIPVRLGISIMSNTKMPIWTIEHSVCSVECALLLQNWFETISTTIKASGIESLRKAERKLLGIITAIIKETCLAEDLDIIEDDVSRVERMASIVMKLWNGIFEGVHLLEIDNVIRAGLRRLASSTQD
ncbi:hypothetical protein F5Y04DRAFT_235983 [Hypomontagnella monticulosa]|nr:hypothetical protein F5Y04DRAFT_235983 [Hypomontagnella monticulosa]